MNCNFIILVACLISVLAAPPQRKELTHEEQQLLRAANEGLDKLVQDLLNNGTDANVRDNEGSTPLVYAAVNGHEGIVRMLIQHEAKINIKDKRGRTSLHYSTEGGHEEVVKLLMQHGADPQIRTPGETAMDLAEMNGFTNIIAILKNHSQNVN